MRFHYAYINADKLTIKTNKSVYTICNQDEPGRIEVLDIHVIGP